MILNNGQQQAISKACKWYKDKISQVFEITGPAGSGKTTIISEIVKQLGLEMGQEVIFIAFTGQASLVLRQKGLPAFTIHSTIYDLVMKPLVDDNGIFQLDNVGKVIKVPRFELKQELENTNIKLMILDEASMVSEEIKQDLLSFNIPIIALGDLDQLPPVIGNPGFLINPDIRLTEIMRQNEGNPIIYLSELARNNENIPLGKYGPRCYVISKEELTDKIILLAEGVICGKNRTRNDLNRYVREELLQYNDIIPQMNEKMICRKNNWNLSIDDYFMVNGLQGIVKQPIDKSRMNSSSFQMDFKPYFIDKFFSDIKVDLKYLYDTYNGKAVNKNISSKFNNGNLMEYAYAITCHLSQGSQYESVLLLEEVLDSRTHKNWLYTGITRAQEFLILVKYRNKYY